ncbi:unnamed protein product [Nezara viridula]|uniref:GPI ethanolamine phosphate transferase 1 n=1 Tax=Nezara viridula TaxID=85310 RepID=A0A9P0MHZ1_NEZVI|nr:unnamed protein product [Nezara viridula]
MPNSRFDKGERTKINNAQEKSNSYASIAASVMSSKREWPILLRCVGTLSLEEKNALYDIPYHKRRLLAGNWTAATVENPLFCQHVLALRKGFTTVHDSLNRLRYKEAGGEGCSRPQRGASRGVLLLSHGQSDMDGKAVGRVLYQQTVLQWEELFSVLAGIKDHVVFGRSCGVGSVLSSVDAVFYFGPDGVLDKFNQSSLYFSFTYPMARMDEEPLIDNDKFVFETFHQVLDSSQTNDTIREGLMSKVLFVLYLTSAALAGLKYPNNETMIYETQHFLSRETSNFTKHLQSFYSDEDTVFLSVPHWSILKEQNPKLSVFGRGTSRNPSTTIELADVCPLLAVLLGIPIPQESVGRLPLSYLNMSQEEEAKALACNALQLHQLVFPPESSYRKQSISTIMDYINKKQYAQSMLFSEQMIKISQSYLHRSQQTFDRIIFSIVIISLVGWILLLITVPMIGSSSSVQIPRRSSFAILITFSTVALFEIFYVTLELDDPLIYITFMLLSLLPWILVFIRYLVLDVQPFVSEPMMSVEQLINPARSYWNGVIVVKRKLGLFANVGIMPIAEEEVE